MAVESESPYIRVDRTWSDRLYPVILVVCTVSAILFVQWLVERHWSAASSEDDVALHELIRGVFFAVGCATASAILHWGSMRGIKRAVIDLVRRHQPMKRRALLKAGRPERYKQRVLLATNELLDDGRLGHSREGYTVNDVVGA